MEENGVGRGSLTAMCFLVIMPFMVGWIEEKGAKEMFLLACYLLTQHNECRLLNMEK
jgi:hypothetical protein